MNNPKSDYISILFVGDIVGRAGRKMLRDHLSELKKGHSADLVIVNGENAAGGFGIDNGTYKEICSAGADVITSGNHIWGRKEAKGLLENSASAVRLLRPDNFPPDAPGSGVEVVELDSGPRIAILNLQGRVFMSDLVDCPFRAFDRIEEEL